MSIFSHVVRREGNSQGGASGPLPFGAPALAQPKEDAMRFMIVVKADERLGVPPMELMAAIGKLGDEAMRAGALVETGGLLPSAMGARIKLAGGKLTVVDGPFTESKELIGGFAIYDVESKQQAIEWTSRFMQLHKDHWAGWEGESEIRQLFDAPPTGQGRP
jgi:hypothetical protein